MNSPAQSFSIVIKSSMKAGKNKASQTQQFLNTIITNCGDADVVTSHNKTIDPELKLYTNIPLMINTNDDIENFRANGTLCRGCTVKLKPSAQVRKKIRDGRLINTISVDEAEYILCKH